MSKKLLFALLFASLLIASCKKSSDIPLPAKEFVIEGVKDVDMGDIYGGYLDISVVFSRGNTEQVALGALGLPAGISVSFEPQGEAIVNGIQMDHLLADFVQTGHALPGRYPVKIIGTAPSYSKSYDLLLTVPEFNGWFVDNEPIRKGDILFENVIGNGIMTVRSNDGHSSLEFLKYGMWPEVDGTYVYTIGDPYYYPGAVQISYSGRNVNSGTFYSKSPDTPRLTVIMKDGKTRISLPAIEMKDSTNVKTVDANVFE